MGQTIINFIKVFLGEKYEILKLSFFLIWFNMNKAKNYFFDISILYIYL